MQPGGPVSRAWMMLPLQTPPPDILVLSQNSIEQEDSLLEQYQDPLVPILDLEIRARQL